MKKYFAEFIGTFVLVFVGVGSAVLAGAHIGNLGVGLCFGLAVIAMAYAVGKVSGGHFNPAVSIGMWAAGRIPFGTFWKYAVAQFIGATVGAAVIYLLAIGTSDYSIAVNGLGHNGWGIGYAGGYDLTSALVFEFVATLIFVCIILEVTETKTEFAGIAIGLTLAFLLIVGMQITGGSLNPARSFGPAIFVGGKALCQLWLFLIVPTLAGVAAGLIHRQFGLNKKIK